MAIFKTYKDSSLGLKGSTPSAIKPAKEVENTSSLGFSSNTPDKVNLGSPDINSGLGYGGANPAVEPTKLGNSNFIDSSLSLKGQIPSYNYEDNLPEQGISRLSTDATPPPPNHFA